MFRSSDSKRLCNFFHGRQNTVTFTESQTNPKRTNQMLTAESDQRPAAFVRFLVLRWHYTADGTLKSNNQIANSVKFPERKIVFFPLFISNSPLHSPQTFCRKSVHWILWNTIFLKVKQSGRKRCLSVGRLIKEHLLHDDTSPHKELRLKTYIYYRDTKIT